MVTPKTVTSADTGGGESAPGGGPAPGVPLIARHREYLIAQGIAAEFLDAEHIAPLLRSVETWKQVPADFEWAVEKETPSGILFGSVEEGNILWQFRPDSPREDAPKYASAAGVPPAVPIRSAPLPEGAPQPVGRTLLIVEGTKQALAVASALRGDPTYVVAGIAGCANWSRGKQLHPHLATNAKGAAKVVVILDFDAGTNPNVYAAGIKLQKALANRLGGGRRNVVSFTQLPALGTDSRTGIDDLLATMPEEERVVFLEDLIAEATPKPADVVPSRRQASSAEEGQSGFFDLSGALDPIAVADAILKDSHFAVDKLSGRIARYSADEGVYAFEPEGEKSPHVKDAMIDLLSSDYHDRHVGSVESVVRHRLRREGRYLDHRLVWGELLHVGNGWLAMDTGTLTDHTPDRFTTQKLAVDYDPAATCPAFDATIKAATTLADGSDQVDIFLDTASLMLDDRLPDRLLYLTGPPRAGKGTATALLESLIVGEPAAVPLSAFSGDKFATSDLYGEVLSICGETEKTHVPNVAEVLKATGGDVIRAQYKGVNAFAFKNRALLVFLGNNLPSINDAEGAFLARTTVVHFPHSNVGREDPAIKEAVAKEGPGFLNRLLAARAARHARGMRYLPSHPEAHAAFRFGTSPVAEFIDDRVDLVPPGVVTGTRTAPAEWLTLKNRLYAAYQDWVKVTGGNALKRSNFLTAIAATPFSIREGATSDGRAKGLICRLRADDTGEYADPRALVIHGSDGIARPVFRSDYFHPAPAVAVSGPTATTNPAPDQAQHGQRRAFLAAAWESASADSTLSRLTPEFWALIDRHGWWAPRPIPLTDEELAAITAEAQREDPENRFAAAAARNRALDPENVYNQAEYTLPSSVMLADLAAALHLPEVHARGYLQAINDRLRAIDIRILERRTAAPGTPGEDTRLIPEFDRDAKDRAEAQSKRAEKSARAAKKALDAAKKAKKSSAEITELEKTLAGATGLHEAAKAHERNVKSLPSERHGFAISLAPIAAAAAPERDAAQTA